MIRNAVVFGTGNVSKALCPALLRAGVEISQVVSRDQERCEEFCRQLDDHMRSNPDPGFTVRMDQRAQPVSSLEKLDARADIYLLAVRDDAIASLSDHLAPYLPADRLMTHLSGALSPEILSDHFSKRACIWPLYSFSGQTANWSSIPVFVTAGNEILGDVRDLASRLSGQVHSIRHSDKEKVHLAAVFANNFSNYNLQIAQKILDMANVPLKVLEPLTAGMIEKAFKSGPGSSQSGPAHRGDVATLEKQLNLLRETFPQYFDLYKTYSEIIGQKK